MGMVVDRFQKFNPKSIPDLYRWYDASDSTTITETSGNVSQWDDKSGNGYHGTQTVDANRPTRSTSPTSGQPSIRFVKSSSEYLITTASVPSVSTSFVAMHRINPTSGYAQFPIGGDVEIGKFVAGTAMFIPQPSFDPDAVLCIAGGEAADPPNMSRADGFSNNTDGIVYCYWDWVTDLDNQVFHNLISGTETVTNTNNNTPTADYYIGVATQDTTGSTVITGTTYSNSHVMEIIEYDRKLTETEMNQVRDYLNERWRIY